MKALTKSDVRDCIIRLIETQLAANGITSGDVTDDFDLIDSGVIDSLGIVTMVGAVEELAEGEIDFEALDFEQIAIVGKFCAFVEDFTAKNA